MRARAEPAFRGPAASVLTVVPRGRARIRVQLSAEPERADLERAVAAFTKVGRALGIPHKE